MIAQEPQLLIVDDDPAMSGSIEAVLRADGYTHIDVLNDANAAVAHINNGGYDLVLLDVMMPGLTGFQLLDAVNREALHTAFIILTGDVSIESTVQALRRGASDYVRKPCDPDELLIRVRRVLKQQQLRTEHQQLASENRQLERQLRHTQKVEAVGALAHGVAHDFNNILAIITGNVELARLNMEGDHRSREYLDKVLLAGTRAKELVNQLLTFSRQQDGDWQSVELNSLVAECVTLVRASIPRNINIRHEQARQPYFIKGDATQIHQIVINLCINASHAMEATGGTLEISLDRRSITANSAAKLAPGDYIRLVVADSGAGIPPEVMDRIFDPYFSTKEPGKGSGMGLAVVHGIVRNHGGEINVRSEPGVGSEFEILLPLTLAHEATNTEAPGEPLTTGKGRILLVDDEEMVVDVLRRILVQLGYEVDSYSDSNAALAQFETQPGHYDLLLTDMTMPGLSGEQLARSVRELDPDLPIIVCSGLSHSIDRTALDQLGIASFLAKPIDAKTLGNTVADALRQRNQERRREPRFAARSPAFVIIDDDNRPGDLVDVSLVGLGVALDHEPGAISSHRVSIVVGDDELANLPCRQVITRNEGKVCTCGLEFTDLSDAQQSRLQAIIRSHGVPIPA